MSVFELKSSSIGIENYCDWISILKTYRKIVKKSDTVLEIGASFPPKTISLSKNCKKVIGIELLPERLPKNFNNIEYVVGDWQKLTKSVKKNSVDVCVATHVLEHIPNDLEAINQLHKVLKPCGVALISTPNRERLAKVILKIIAGNKNLSSEEHCREYTKKDLIKLFKKSYFKKYEVIPVGFGLIGGPFLVYSNRVPKLFLKYANFWEAHLYK